MNRAGARRHKRANNAQVIKPAYLLSVFTLETDQKKKIDAKGAGDER